MSLAVLLALVATPVAPRPLQETYTVERVVDGDTLWIEKDGAIEKLRLLSVDTEEKLSGLIPYSPTKPATVLGHETMLWTRELVEATAEPGAPPRVGLRLPAEIAPRDRYGRLLCHVVLADGRDLNLLLVERGLSPYYVKYGVSRIAHEEFVRAQETARRRGDGIWAPEHAHHLASRPYELLLPWWEARAAALAALDARREAERRAGSKPTLVRAEDPGELEAALGRQVDVFGTIERIDERDDGALAVRFASDDPERALVWIVAADARDPVDEHRLRDTTKELAQNYVLVHGRPYRAADGFRIVTPTAAWRLAGPRPSLPIEEPHDTPTMTQEIELKFAVEDARAFDALIRHLDLPSREFHRTALQVNHFFDSPTFGLRAQGLALRLREEAGRYLLALKGPATNRSEDGALTERLEEQVQLPAHVALDVLQGQVSARDVLADRLRTRNAEAIARLDEALGRAELHYVGKFENRRTRLTNVRIEGIPKPLVFELDATRLSSERTDYEIEVELDASAATEEAQAAIKAVLAAAGIEWHATTSKARRFFELATKR